MIHSGDFRLSGDHPERILQWAKEANNWGADVLLIEGTSFSFKPEKEAEEKTARKSLNEQTLVNELEDMITMNTEDLFIYNPYIRNVERMKKIDEIIRQHGRTMVWESSYAHILHTFYPDAKWTLLEETLEDKAEVPAYAEKAVTLKELSDQPGKYVLQNSYKNVHYLEQFEQGCYLHSNGEPLGEFDPGYAQLQDYLAALNITFISLGASGHATKENLLKVAKRANAGVTIPWHTFNPELFYEALKSEGLNTFVPEYQKEYQH